VNAPDVQLTLIKTLAMLSEWAENFLSTALMASKMVCPFFCASSELFFCKACAISHTRLAHRGPIPCRERRGI